MGSGQFTNSPNHKFTQKPNRWSRKVDNMSDFGAVLRLQEDIAVEFSDQKNRLEVKDSIIGHL